MKVSTISHHKGSESGLNTMTFAHVDSSAIRMLCWSNGLRGVGYLGVVFTSGKTYHYSDVPVSVFHELLASESIGSKFNDIVRNKYEFRELS
jgi:hypothetical protein